MNNLDIYNQVRAVPQEALKTIGAGRLKGMSDINPMWRIKKLTELFGPCGLGWWYEIKNQWLEQSPTKETAAFCNIELFYVDPESGEVSKPIPGTGGSMFAAQEKNGIHVSDECFKMALTDAISVAAKALGVGADVYWGKDKTKYGIKPEPKSFVCADCGKAFAEFTDQSGRLWTAAAQFEASRKVSPDGKARCKECRAKMIKGEVEDAEQNNFNRAFDQRPGA